MDLNEEYVLESLKKYYTKTMPPSEEILNDAMHAAMGNNHRTASWVKSNFGTIVLNAENAAHEIYRSNERSASVNALQNVFRDIASNETDIESTMDIFDKYYSALDQFFMSISQERKACEESIFEHIISELMSALKYPYALQAIINEKPDFLYPSMEHYNRISMDCIVFTAKHNLRKKWRQVVTKRIINTMYYLATIDSKIKKSDLIEMRQYRLCIVTPAELKNKIYSENGNVISFETFFNQHLDPAMKRWKKNKII
jgi:hypothetical protein